VSESDERATDRPGDPQRRRLIRGVAGISVLALAPFQIARGATLLGVRVWPAADYTRVTLEHDGELTFNHFMVRDSSPLRLVVDIDGIDLTPTLKELVSKVEPDDPYIKLVRIGQNRPKVVRLVIELKVDVKPQVFQVDPVGPYQSRLVLDLFPATPIDPIAALLQQQAQGAQEAQPAGPQPPLAEAQPAPAPLEQPMPPPDAGREPPRAEPEAAPQAQPSAPARSGSSRSRAVSRILTVAIDPGHGGEDPGAIGKRGTFEKSVTLSIGERLAAMIQDQSGLRVLLTRDGDYFVPLGTRVTKARCRPIFSCRSTPMRGSSRPRAARRCSRYPSAARAAAPPPGWRRSRTRPTRSAAPTSARTTRTSSACCSTCRPRRRSTTA